jgi:rhodanese-related sulfurtransferase
MACRSATPCDIKQSLQGGQNGSHYFYRTTERQARPEKESIRVIETLAPERYRDAHIPGALNIPPEKIKELAPQLLPTKDVEIITYCANTH